METNADYVIRLIATVFAVSVLALVFASLVPWVYHWKVSEIENAAKNREACYMAYKDETDIAKVSLACKYVFQSRY